MKKKVLSIVLSTVIVFMLIGCNGQPEESTNTEEEVVEAVEVKDEAPEELEEEKEDSEQVEAEEEVEEESEYNPIEVEYVDGGMEDEGLVDYFTEEIFPYLEDMYDITFLKAETSFSVIFITYITQKTGSEDISLEMWGILNELMLFEKFHHTFCLYADPEDGNTWIAYTKLDEVGLIYNGKMDYVQWNGNIFFKEGDESEAEKAYNEAMEFMELLEGIGDEEQEEDTTEEFDFDSWFEEYKSAINDVVVDVYGGELTKIVFEEGAPVLVIAYNSMWNSEDTVKKELFDFTKLLADPGFLPDTDLEITATTGNGKNYKAYTNYENMLKIKNLEMSYGDWVGEAF